ncbi:hypothetical protein [Niveispirillum lacus]|uniref:hypothetical protein n=1 Tax=Niveispirillum lacus TaxID=1981099 RepID=UPI0013FD7C49|nr:hypothetical protein [Niveispirillum lacus]
MTKAADQMLERLARQTASLSADDEQSALDWIERVGEFDSSTNAPTSEPNIDARPQK